MKIKAGRDQGEELPGRGKRRCKDPEVGVFLACFGK